MKVKNRERIHSLFSIALSLSLVLAPLPVHATDTGGTDAGADTGSNPTTIDVSANGSEETSVYAEIGSHYELTIPKRVTLDGEQKTGSYSVAVTGDIPGTEVVSVVPDTSFTMSSHKIDDATALATQDKTLWRYSDMLPTDPVVAAGEIDATAISAGEWDGKLNFNTELREHIHAYVSNSRTVDIPWENTSNDSYKFEQVGTTWTSNNYGVDSSIASSAWTVDLEEDVEYSFKYKVSSESGCDKLTIKLDDTTVVDSVSGEGTEQIYKTTLTAGNHTLVATYSKDGSVNGNDDQAYLVLDTSVTTEVHTCSVCNASDTHVYDEGTITTEPTCTTEGIKTFTCTACGDSYTEPVPALGHSYDEGIITTEPTCTSEGIKTFTCTACGDSYTEPVPPAHTDNNSDEICDECGDEIQYTAFTLSADNYEMAGITRSGDVVIPETFVYDGVNYKTTGIDAFAFTQCSSLTGVVIPDSVTFIGQSAFQWCSNLTNVIISNSVTYMGEYAFYQCANLTSVKLSTNVDFYEIEDHAFDGCSSLSDIEIPNNIRWISSFAFYDCTSLTSIELPDSITTVSNSAFQNCESLTSVVIPSSVTSIGNSAFRGCTSLTSVIIPDSVTSIGNKAFEDCSKLTSVTLPDGLTSIGAGAFWLCSNLTSITIPSSVTSIGKNAFYSCGSFTINYKGTEEQWNAITKGSDWNISSTPTLIYNYTE